MIFQDNVIKEYLKNVYFIAGTPCGGKTTVARELGEKYKIPVYVIDDQFTIHQLKSDEEHQPCMNRQFRDSDEFFGRSVEEYKKWLLGNSREQLDYILLDLIKLSQDRIILCDLHIAEEDIVKFTDPSGIAFLIRKPDELVEEYSNRPDHEGFRNFIHSASDYERAAKTCNDTLYSLNIDFYNYIKHSDYFWLERDNNRSVGETVQMVEQYFGWKILNGLEIKKVDKGTVLENELIKFIQNCSWEDVKEHLTAVVRDNCLSDWESFFVAVVDGRIVGMISVMKEDYYPLPDIMPWISSVFVDEEYRGNRISAKMIAYANDYLKSLGFEKSFIPSEHVGLYEQYGYHYVSDITNYGGGTDHLFEKYI